jgi:aerobic-type carbon monoxide dehydrogenase small subunit (CoxS/CutS family)
LIVAIFSLPIGVLAYLLAANYTPQIASAQLELSGNSLQKPLMKVLYGLTSSKNIVQGCASGSCGVDLTKQTSLVASSLDAASGVNAQLAGDLNTTLDGLAKKDHKDLALENLQAEWKTLAAASANISTPTQRAELTVGYDQMAGRVKQLISYVGDSSSLILDPDLDSYYLVDVTLLAMPEAITNIANTAAIGSKIVSGSSTAVDQAALANESVLLQGSLDRVAASNRTTFDADAANHGVSPTLQPKLTGALQEYRNAVTSYLATLKTIGEKPSQVTAAALATQAEAVQKASLDYWNTSAAELDGLLNMRIADFQTGRIQALGFSALAVVIAAIVAFSIGRSITKPLRELVRNLAPGATLLGVSVERIAEASQSKTPSAEESAIICEELNAHADNMRKAVLELARHVEGSAAASRLAKEDAGPAHS